MESGAGWGWVRLGHVWWSQRFGHVVVKVDWLMGQEGAGSGEQGAGTGEHGVGKGWGRERGLGRERGRGQEQEQEQRQE